jgi:hypothetical protein
MATKSLFFVATGSFLLEHPLTDIGGAIHYLNASRLNLIQEANSIDVDNANFIQVQDCRQSEPANFVSQIAELRTPKLTGQTNPSPVLTKPFDSQRHCWHPNPPAEDARRMPNRNIFISKGIVLIGISYFRNFAFDGKNTEE